MSGNGLTDWKFDSWPGFIESAFWHSLYDTETHDHIVEDECDYSGVEFGHFDSYDCRTWFDIFEDNVRKINRYDIFDSCYGLQPDGEAF